MVALVRKLHPSRFPNMSPKMAAIVGFILDQRYTNPQIMDMCITSDGAVLAQHEDEQGMNHFMGHESTLLGNWKMLLDMAGLTQNERTIVEAMFASRITHW